MYAYESARAGDGVDIPPDLRPIIGAAFVQSLLDARHPVLVASCAQRHAHAVTELPDNIVAVRAIAGEAKKVSSRAVRRQLPGTVWSRGGEYRRIKDDHHLANAYDYVLYGQEDDAWVWCSEEGERIRTVLEVFYPRRRYGRKALSALPRRAGD